MVRVQPNRRWSGWRAILRRRAAVLLLAVGLVGLLAVAVAVGWVGWLVDHPGQVWAWVKQRWFAASALGVFVAAVGVVVTVAMPRWQEARKERREREQLARQRQDAAAAEQAAWARRCRELLEIWPLPAVEDVNPYEVGVFYSRRADAYRTLHARPPYVPRTVDDELLDRLAACQPPVRVVATIRLEEHARLAAAPGELGRSVRELLNRFDPGAVTLPVGFEDAAERAAITELYPGEPVTGGLAEHLAAAHELVDRLEHGEASVPEGAGLVLAAVDCRRAGLDRPVSREDLQALLPLYLRRLRPLAPLLAEGDLDRGLGWATEPVGRTAALLVAEPDPLAGTFRVADPIVDHVERRTGRRLLDPAVWQLLLGRVSPEEVLEVGVAAYFRGERHEAEAAWRRVIDSGHQDLAPKAAVNVGVLLKEQGDAAGARVAFQLAFDSGHHDAAPAAAVSFGVLLKEQGEVAAARAAYQLAIDSGHHAHGPMAAHNLGVLLAEQGDAAGARAAFQLAFDSGHAKAAMRARRALSDLEQGDRQA